ncbi:MAG: redoxin domain-containing protein [Chloroflexia bacterium]|nr:redoxin domain-containing protein [Chloroflexia bacterium]
MHQHHEELQELGVAVLLISTETAKEALLAAGETPPPFPTLHDPEHVVINRYGVFHADEPNGYLAARPSIFILDSTGTVRYTYVGEHSRDRPAIGTILLALESL